MVQRKKSLILLMGITLSLAACLNFKQPRNKIEYYTLEYTSPFVGDYRPLPYAIRVDQFSVSPIYNSNRIIYRDKSFKRQAYAYYKWRANPGDFVSYFLNRDMKKAGLFKAILSRNSSVPSSYLLEGTVDDFFELDGENDWQAVLSVSIVLMDEQEADISKKILFQKTYHASKPCQRKHPRALAQAMSMAMSEVSGKVIKDIYDYIEAGTAKN